MRLTCADSVRQERSSRQRASNRPNLQESRSASVPFFRRRMIDRRRARAARVRRAVRPLRLPAGLSSIATTRRWPRATASPSCPIVPNRGVITDRNGIVLAQSYSAYTLEMHAVARSRTSTRRSTSSPPSSRSQPRDRKRFKRAARRIEELREPAAAHAAVRRGSGALRRQPLPFSRRRDQGAAVPPVSVRRDRVARHRLHRPHQRPRRRAHRRLGRDRELQGLRLHRQGRHRAVVRARAARHDRRRGGRGRCRRARGAHAVAHGRRSRATT